jgi:CheY-like chemotaxis protein
LPIPPPRFNIKIVPKKYLKNMPKILIVEDDTLVSRLYQKVFKFENYDVDFAMDGEQGLEKAKTNKPTLILLDVMMPKMNGLQLLEKLKSEESTKSIPVVMLTNLAGQQDAEEALKRGAVKYIMKSEYQPKQIVSMVKEVISGYSRGEIPGS